MRMLPFVLVLTLIGTAFGQSDPDSIPGKCTSTGNLEIRDFRSKIFHNTRKLRILLPAGYREEKNAQTKYPILYLNDGQNLFDVCTAIFGPKEWKVDETANRLIAEGKVEPLIIVGIDNAGRHTKERLEIEKQAGSRPNEYISF